MTFEVPSPILCSPYAEPDHHWFIPEGAVPQVRDGRRPAFVFQPRDGDLTWDLSDGTLAKLPEYDRAWELTLVNRARPLYPPDFESLVTKLERPLHPPGRDVRCIVSVGMVWTATPSQCGTGSLWTGRRCRSWLWIQARFRPRFSCQASCLIRAGM